jgi:hypothetical protein
VVEIDYVLGSIITRSPLPGIIGFVASSSSFDQYSSSLLLLGLGTSYNLSMIVFNTLSNTYLTGFVPGNVWELACDNTLFAMNTHGVTSDAEENLKNYQVFPNTTSEKRYLATNALGITNVRIFSQMGQLLLTNDFLGKELLERPLKGFKRGTYLVNIRMGQLSETKKTSCMALKINIKSAY